MPEKRISVYLWSDEWFRGLEIEERVLFLQLLTSGRTCSVPGLVKASPLALADESARPVHRVEEILQKFSEDGQILLPQGKRWLHVTRAAKFEAPASRKSIQGWLSHLIGLDPAGDVLRVCENLLRYVPRERKEATGAVLCPFMEDLRRDISRKGA